MHIHIFCTPNPSYTGIICFVISASVGWQYCTWRMQTYTPRSLTTVLCEPDCISMSAIFCVCSRTCNMWKKEGACVIMKNTVQFIRPTLYHILSGTMNWLVHVYTCTCIHTIAQFCVHSCTCATCSGKIEQHSC